MVKQRMATADVAGEVACLRQRVLGMRVANLYDLNSKVHMLFSQNLTRASAVLAIVVLTIVSTFTCQPRSQLFLLAGSACSCAGLACGHQICCTMYFIH